MPITNELSTVEETLKKSEEASYGESVIEVFMFWHPLYPYKVYL